MMMNNPITSAIFFLLTISASEAQDPLEFPTFVTTTSPPSLAQSQIPSAAPSISLSEPTTTLQPTKFEGDTGNFPLSPSAKRCQNYPDFFVEFWDYKNCTWNLLNLTCDDDRVGCYDNGNFGPAISFCCKCKFQCAGICKDPVYNPPQPDFGSDCYDGEWNDIYYGDNTEGIPSIVVLFLVVFFGAIIARVVYNCQGDRPERRAVQQTMATRRQQQRENNTAQGLTEHERNNERFELFVTKFYFQTVLPGKSNITANSLRGSASKPDEEEHPSSKKHDTEDEGAVDAKYNSLSERLSSWRRPSAKDECCICLECYSEGETICAPITTECNHVFHEGCILEWLKTKDHCPLCRVELLKA